MLSYTQRFGLGIPATPIFVRLFARSMLPYKRGKHYARTAETTKIASRTKERPQWKTPVYSKSSRTAVQLPKHLTALAIRWGQQKGVPMSKIDKKLLMLIKSLTKEHKEFIFHFIQYFFKADLQ